MRIEINIEIMVDTASVLETEHRQGKSRLVKLGEVFGRSVKAIKEKMAEGCKKQKALEVTIPGEA